jgi:CRP-like cAMP-binding protein
MPIDIESLRHLALFESLAEADLAGFCLLSSHAVFTPNQTVYRIGEAISSAYLILEGRVRVFIPDRYGHLLVIGQLTTGQLLGRHESSEGEVCSSTAVTLTDTHFLILDRTNLAYLFGKKPEAVFIVITALEKHLREVQLLLIHSGTSNLTPKSRRDRKADNR